MRNPYLLNTHPEQLEALLQNCPTVASTDISEMLRKVPRIAYMPWHNTAQIVRYGHNSQHRTDRQVRHNAVRITSSQRCPILQDTNTTEAHKSR